jgi:hypothetical protein
MLQPRANFLFFVFIFLLMSVLLKGHHALADFEEDPIKKTESNVVAVTRELLEREGDVGPASPTIKMHDTSRFLVKEPYHDVDDEVGDDSATMKRPWWHRWFFKWDKDRGSP